MNRTILLGIILALLCSCKGLQQPFPNKKLYAINAGASTAPVSSEAKAALLVRPVSVASPFDGITFTYKIGESQFETDYYNNFVTEPGRLLTGELVRRLSESGLYATVTDARSIVSTSVWLEVNITSLHGDYTNRSSPSAVIEARVFLLKDDPASDQILMQKTYRVRELAASDTPDALVAAWGKAFGRMIDELVADLQKITGH